MGLHEWFRNLPKPPFFVASMYCLPRSVFVSDDDDNDNERFVTDLVFLELHKVEVFDALDGVILQPFMQGLFADHFAEIFIHERVPVFQEQDGSKIDKERGAGQVLHEFSARNERHMKRRICWRKGRRTGTDLGKSFMRRIPKPFLGVKTISMGANSLF